MGRQGAASAASLALRFPRSAKGREHQQHHWPSGLHGAPRGGISSIIGSQVPTIGGLLGLDIAGLVWSHRLATVGLARI